jgi:glycosyltransferase involved in cell wall biosynthesis
MNSFNPAIVIPVYRHGKACMNVVNSLEEYCRSTSTKIILVDDGNEEETKNCLSQISSEYPDLITLVTLPQNSGKGGAFFAGIKKCTELGITHALQIDADGQHDTNRCAFFFDKAKELPDTLICGYPEYDESAPGHRKNGRKFANTWCAAVTWEKQIKDSMCGFRLYPVEKTFRCISKSRMDMRMGFDIDILVRLIWSGLTYAFYPVKVTYPSDGISNFNVVRDNVRISWVFTKLCCGMFLRSPLLLWRKISGCHLYKGGE